MNGYYGRPQALAAALCLGLLLCACSPPAAAAVQPSGSGEPGVRTQQENTAAVQTAAPQTVTLRLPEATGTVVYENNGVRLDASNARMGYVMVRAEANESRLKLRIGTDAMTYTYDLPSGADYAAFPLQQGDGRYTVRVLAHAYDNLYEPIFEQAVDVTLDSAFAPFLVPSQYVDYTADSEAVARSFALLDASMSDRKIVDTLYRFVADTVEYDYDKAATVPDGYLPDVDETLRTKRGICFDYSALLATMLRVQGIPTQLVIGQVQPENILHAWNLIYLDGGWELADATLDGVDHVDTDYTAQRVY